MGMFDKIKKFRPMDYFESAQGLDGMPTGDQLMKDYDDQGIDFSEGSQIYDRGSQMMERGSAYNQQARASMQNNASDSQAESFRQSQRLAAMGGGMPTGVMTAQNMQGANNMQANASAQFENQFAQNQNQGIGILSGAMNNQAQLMQQAQGADQARRMAKNNASQQFMGVLGSGLKMAAASQGATTGQRGGSVSAAPKGSHYMPNGKLMKNSEMEGYQNGGKVMDYIHSGLDVAGMVPGLGLLPDMANSALYGGEALLAGDKATRNQKLSMLGLSLGAAIPIAGQFATAGKVASKVNKASKGSKASKAIKVTPEDRAIYRKALKKQDALANPKYNKYEGEAHIGGSNPFKHDKPKFANPKNVQKVNRSGVDEFSGLPVEGHPAGMKEGGMVRGYNHGGMVHPTNDFENGGGPSEQTEEEKAEYNRRLEKNNQLNRVSSREDEEMEAGIRQPEYEASAPNSLSPETQEVDTPNMPTGRGYGTLASSKAKGALNATAYGVGAGARGIEAGAGAIYGGAGTLLGAAKKGVGKFFEKKEGGSMFGKAMMGAGHLATEYANPGSMMEHMRIKQLNTEEEGTDEPKVADLGLSQPKLGKQQGGYMQMQHGGNVQSQRMGLLSQIPMRVGGGKIG